MKKFSALWLAKPRGFKTNLEFSLKYKGFEEFYQKQNLEVSVETLSFQISEKLICSLFAKTSSFLYKTRVLFKCKNFEILAQDRNLEVSKPNSRF